MMVLLHSGAVKWGRLGAGDHMFSLPITPTAHLNQRGFGQPGHSSRLSHVSRADSYAARHTFAETHSSLGRNSSALPLPPSSSRTSGRHSTPASPSPSSRSAVKSSPSKATSLAPSGESRAAFKSSEPAGYLPEAGWRDSISRVHVPLDVDAHSAAVNVVVSDFSRADSFSSSSSQDSVSASSMVYRPEAQPAATR